MMINDKKVKNEAYHMLSLSKAINYMISVCDDNTNLRF